MCCVGSTTTYSSRFIVQPSGDLEEFIPVEHEYRTVMVMDTRKVVLGALLLVASTVIMFVSGQFGLGIPLWAASLAVLGLAAGALFLGTADDARPV